MLLLKCSWKLYFDYKHNFTSWPSKPKHAHQLFVKVNSYSTPLFLCCIMYSYTLLIYVRYILLQREKAVFVNRWYHQQTFLFKKRGKTFLAMSREKLFEIFFFYGRISMLLINNIKIWIILFHSVFVQWCYFLIKTNMRYLRATNFFGFLPHIGFINSKQITTVDGEGTLNWYVKLVHTFQCYTYWWYCFIFSKNFKPFDIENQTNYKLFTSNLDSSVIISLTIS